MKKEITFDRFIRGAGAVCLAALIIFLINRLSNVLIPFVVAWLIAYLIYPIVIFFEKTCHFRNRVLSIFVTMLVLFTAIAAALGLIIPPVISEFEHLKTLIVEYLQSGHQVLPLKIEEYIRSFLASKDFQRIFDDIDYMGIIQETVAQVANIVSRTATIIFSIFSACIVLLYLFFILLDYEQFSEGWKKFIPYKQRSTASNIFHNVSNQMNRYFRGQSLIALIVGILFAIGFSIIGLPMGIVLGLFIGLLNLVPYLQTIGFIPAIIMALLKAADTGQNFWVILLLILVVFLVVQGIQDMILTPKIMGKMMGLNPAGILLSLSIWGSLLGFIGLIIALPLTALLIEYYRNYLEKEEKKSLQETCIEKSGDSQTSSIE